MKANKRLNRFLLEFLQLDIASVGSLWEKKKGVEFRLKIEQKAQVEGQEIILNIPIQIGSVVRKPYGSV